MIQNQNEEILGYGRNPTKRAGNSEQNRWKGTEVGTVMVLAKVYVHATDTQMQL